MSGINPIFLKNVPSPDSSPKKRERAEDFWSDEEFESTPIMNSEIDFGDSTTTFELESFLKKNISNDSESRSSQQVLSSSSSVSSRVSPKKITNNFKSTSLDKTARSFEKAPQPQGLETPSPVRRLAKIVRGSNFATSDLSSKERRSVEAGFETLSKTVPDTPRKRKRSNKARDIFYDCFKEHDRVDVRKFHKNSFQVLVESDDARYIAEKAHEIYQTCQNKPLEGRQPIEIINVDHIVEKGKRGFHLCLDEAARQSLKHRIESKNGVYHAAFKVGSGEKYSTFFPLSSLEELCHLIEHRQVIARENNRQLCSVPGKEYLIELYKDRIVIKTAFPIFYFEKLNSDCSSYSFTENMQPVTPEELKRLARNALTEYLALPYRTRSKTNPIRYRLKNENQEITHLIIDLAPSFPALKVPQGILIQFSQHDFSDLLNQFKELDFSS